MMKCSICNGVGYIGIGEGIRGIKKCYACNGTGESAENIMYDRKHVIEEWIKNRAECKEIYKCVFYITTPAIEETLYDNPYIKEICDILKKNGIEYGLVDSLPGAFNLDRYWIETAIKTPIECIVEYCGVYPIHWNVSDVVRLEQLDTEGSIIISVSWIQENGELIDNH